MLADRPIKTRVGSRMAKLDPRSMEWFLLNAMLVLYRPMVADALERGATPAFKATSLEKALRALPPSILPDYRKERSYLSSILAKNELLGTNPYNRRLFWRAAHGYYVLNPALEVEVKGAWVAVNELMGLPLQLRSLGSDIPTAAFAEWMEGARRAIEERNRATHSAAEVAPEPEASPQPEA